MLASMHGCINLCSEGTASNFPQQQRNRTTWFNSIRYLPYSPNTHRHQCGKCFKGWTREGSAREFVQRGLILFQNKSFWKTPHYEPSAFSWPWKQSGTMHHGQENHNKVTPQESSIKPRAFSSKTNFYNLLFPRAKFHHYPRPAPGNPSFVPCRFVPATCWTEAVRRGQNIAMDLPENHWTSHFWSLWCFATRMTSCPD